MLLVVVYPIHNGFSLTEVLGLVVGGFGWVVVQFYEGCGLGWGGV